MASSKHPVIARLIACATDNASEREVQITEDPTEGKFFVSYSGGWLLGTGTTSEGFDDLVSAVVMAKAELQRALTE